MSASHRRLQNKFVELVREDKQLYSLYQASCSIARVTPKIDVTYDGGCRKCEGKVTGSSALAATVDFLIRHQVSPTRRRVTDLISILGFLRAHESANLDSIIENSHCLKSYGDLVLPESLFRKSTEVRKVQLYPDFDSGITIDVPYETRSHIFELYDSLWEAYVESMGKDACQLSRGIFRAMDKGYRCLWHSEANKDINGLQGEVDEASTQSANSLLESDFAYTCCSRWSFRLRSIIHGLSLFPSLPWGLLEYLFDLWCACLTSIPPSEPPSITWLQEVKMRCEKPSSGELISRRRRHPSDLPTARMLSPSAGSGSDCAEVFKKHDCGERWSRNRSYSSVSLPPPSPPIKPLPEVLEHPLDGSLFSTAASSGCPNPSPTFEAEDDSGDAPLSSLLEALHAALSLDSTKDAGEMCALTDGVGAAESKGRADTVWESLAREFLECFQGELLERRDISLHQVNNLCKLRLGHVLPYKTSGFASLKNFILSIPGVEICARVDGKDMRNPLVRASDISELKMLMASLQVRPQKQRSRGPSPVPPEVVERLRLMFEKEGGQIEAECFKNLFENRYFSDDRDLIRNLGYRRVKDFLGAVPAVVKEGQKPRVRYRWV